MKSEEKNEIMQRFADHKTDILVSTTVIEVGVDVPNATVILIENAERFGLAQLHQLRGRVGRGKDESYCIFMYGQDSPAIRERLEILQKSRDGFEIAREDLRLRGPGDFFGSIQSGALSFTIGDVFNDSDLLISAGEAADSVLRSDPSLCDLCHEGLRQYIHQHADPEDHMIVL
jgi:ATP-dependent DNA helicase RecG